MISACNAAIDRGSFFAVLLQLLIALPFISNFGGDSSPPKPNTYFDDIFVHSRAEGGQTAMEVHLKHLRRVFEVMRANKLYAKIDNCVFAAEEINVLGCFVSRVGVRADPGKVKATFGC
ncbi:DNA/RNA polymerase [Phytophthora palmivora]|uniref:DNA/RNA polymerase n=1 Tax=Phytophthora palmivora TaxID=4796 RepID=A0A2P4YS32_9STRA|nr:DNA/RNA polymerase [Phytophthora palmivora]